MKDDEFYVLECDIISWIHSWHEEVYDWQKEEAGNPDSTNPQVYQRQGGEDMEDATNRKVLKGNETQASFCIQ